MDKPGEKKTAAVDTGRIAAKLDSLLDKEEWAQAEKLLSYWLGEATIGNDRRGQFFIYNELIGLKRKLQKADEALAAADEALKLGEELDIMDSVGGATAYVNAGTALEAFGRPQEAVLMYKKALPVYESGLPHGSAKLGSLYNNLAIALSLCENYEEALACYDKALNIMSGVEGGRIEQALSYLNMADTYQAMLGLEDGIEKIEDCLEKAQLMLDSEDLKRDGYYAFMADKCIGSFEYFGYFAYAAELKKRVREIYDRLRAI